MIRSFRNRETESLFHGQARTKIDKAIQRSSRRKLLILNAAETLDDLRVPPGNRLEKLSGKRTGQYSIRINSQWRICFRWSQGDAYEVEIVDYH